MAIRNIVELMKVPEDGRDLTWLQESLMNAVRLELSTLPPYLCAYWSITPDSDQTAAGLIRDIYMQEMKHMGLAANMLVGIGGKPAINSKVPTYPGPLPGGVMQGLTVYLAGITPDYVEKVCMAIESPEAPLSRAPGAFPTIGAFYDAIASAFVSLDPEFVSLDVTPKCQQTWEYLGGGDGLVEIANVADALKAIKTIEVEGEGTSLSPNESPGDLAHYYKFASISYGNMPIQKDGHWTWEGDPVPFPKAYPMAAVPAGGWTNAPNVPGNVLDLLASFNKTYKEMLDGLQAAWMGEEGALNKAVGAMRNLQGPAQKLMQIKIGGGATGNYGPDFIV